MSEAIKRCEHGLTDICHCVECEICENKYDRRDIETVSLPNRNAFLACSLCAIEAKMQYYRNAYEKEHEANDRLKTELNLFRTLMLRPETMEALANDPASEQPSVAGMAHRIAGLESLSLDATLYWMETFEIYTRKLAEFAGKKASKDEIKRHLQEKTAAAVKDHAKKAAAEKAVAEVKAERAKPLTSFEKAVKAQAKALKITEAAATEMLKMMGMQP